MNSLPRPRAALSRLWSAVWTASSSSVLVGVFLRFAPAEDGLPVPPEVVHPMVCRACATSNPEARAAMYAALIAAGAIEAPIEPGRASGVPRLIPTVTGP